MTEKYNNYSILVTIASLMLVVVYSNDEYDLWDITVVFFTGYFGCSYIKNKMYFDWFSCFAVSFISIGSILIGIYSIVVIKISDIYLYKQENIEELGLLIILILSLISSFFLNRMNVETK